MLVLIILLIYVQTMILPTINVSLRSVEDVARVGQTSFAAKKLVNAVTNIQLISGDAKQQISLYVPNCGATACTVKCNSNTITFFAPLSPDLNAIAGCPNNQCNGTITAPGSVACNFTLTGPASGLVSIEKKNGVTNATLS